MTKSITAILLLLSVALTAKAQAEFPAKAADTTSVTGTMPQAMPQAVAADISTMAQPLSCSAGSSPLNLPTLTSRGTMPTLWGYYPTWEGMHSWDLHEGLNVSLGTSVFSTFGSGSTWSGAGFSQSIAMLYAMPLTQRLSLSVGGYFSNTSWARTSWRDAGLTAVLGYQIDEHWSTYLYGQKSFISNQPLPAHLVDMGQLGSRIGAAVRYTFNPSFAIQVSFDTGEIPVYTPAPMPVMRTREPQQGRMRP